MSATPLPTSPDQIRELVDTIERGISSGADLVNGIIDRVVGFLDWLPGFITNRVLPWLRRLAAAVQGFFAKVLEFLEGAAFPVFAFIKANSWNDEVRNPVTKVAGELSDGARARRRLLAGTGVDRLHERSAGPDEGLHRGRCDRRRPEDPAVGRRRAHRRVPRRAGGDHHLVDRRDDGLGRRDGHGCRGDRGASPPQLPTPASASPPCSRWWSATGSLVAAEAETFTRLNDRISTSAAFPAGLVAEADVRGHDPLRREHLRPRRTDRVAASPLTPIHPLTVGPPSPPECANGGMP